MKMFAMINTIAISFLHPGQVQGHEEPMRCDHPLPANPLPSEIKWTAGIPFNAYLAGKEACRNATVFRFGKGRDWTTLPRDELKSLDCNGDAFSVQNDASKQCQCGVPVGLEDIVHDTFRHMLERNAACAKSGKPKECMPIGNTEEFHEALRFMDRKVYDKHHNVDQSYPIISTEQEVIYKTWHQYDMLRYGYLMLQDLKVMHHIKTFQENSTSATFLYESKVLHHTLDEYFQTQCPALYQQLSQAIAEREAEEIYTCSYVPEPFPHHEFRSEIEWSHCADSNFEICRCQGGFVRYGEIIKEVDSLPKEGVECHAEVFGSHDAKVKGCECGVVKDMDFIVGKVFEHYDFIRYPRNYKSMLHDVKEDMRDVWTDVEWSVVKRWNAIDGEAALFKFQHLQMQALLKEMSSNDSYEYLAMASAVMVTHKTYDDRTWHITPRYDFTKQCAQLYTKFEEIILARMEWRYVAREGETRQCFGAMRMRYGSPSADKWKTRYPLYYREDFAYGVQCDNKTFGDPVPYKTKECHCGVPKSILTPRVQNNLDVHV